MSAVGSAPSSLTHSAFLGDLWVPVTMCLGLDELRNEPGADSTACPRD